MREHVSNQPHHSLDVDQKVEDYFYTVRLNIRILEEGQYNLSDGLGRSFALNLDHAPTAKYFSSIRIIQTILAEYRYT